VQSYGFIALVVHDRVKVDMWNRNGNLHYVLLSGTISTDLA